MCTLRCLALRLEKHHLLGVHHLPPTPGCDANLMVDRTLPPISVGISRPFMQRQVVSMHQSVLG
jgi:hypothetical protein